jgi:uncharacterized protein (TIGR03437 family)
MARNNFLRFAATFALLTPAVSAQIITTVAGTNSSFPAGSLAAVNAPLGAVTGVAVDGAGNVFVVDSGDSLVFRISASGVINVVAGNGILGFSGDGGPATSASLSSPSAVAVDSEGNLYIADTSNERIRKVSGGTITTVAGNGTFGFSGDGGPGVNASLDNPTGVAVDSAGNIYIADTANGRIRKVSGGMITTIAGNSTFGFSGDGGPAASASLNLPAAIAVDSAGNLYIADLANQRIRKVTNGTITTVAGNGNRGFSGDGGPATSASISGPAGVAVDPVGNLYIADTGNNRIRKVVSGTIMTIAGNKTPGFSGDGGPATSASLNGPFGMAIDSTDALYIADSSNSRVRKVVAGTITTLAGNGNYRFSGDGGPATSASLNLPSGVANDSAGNLYIADFLNNRVRKSSAGTINTVAGSGPSCSISTALVCGVFSGDGGPAANASLNQPFGVALDAAGNLYIADAANNRVRKVSNGTITTVAGSANPGVSGDGGPATNASLYNPTQVAVDSSGNLYIADLGNNRIRKVSGGTIMTVAGNQFQGFSGDGVPAAGAALNLPSGVAVDSAGNLYIADTGNQRIRKVSGGIITTVAGNGTRGFSGDGGPAAGASFNSPTQVAVDSAGNLFIADLYNNRIRMVSNGTISTIAGNGSQGFSGDGGPPASASLSGPNDVAVDSAGNLYIADTGNDRIREVLSNPPYFNSALPAGSSSLALSQESGGKPVTATLTADTATTESSSIAVPGMAYTAAVGSGSSWLSVSPQNGSTPGLITITADPLNLSPGVYNGAIVLSVPLANPPTQTVNVQFTVTPGVPASLSVDQTHMSFTYATTSAARSQTLIVSNSGGGSLNFTASISLNSGVSANWLSVTPQSGTAAPGNPVALAVRADPSSLGPGTYTGNLTIDGGSAGSVTIPITMTITTNPLVLLLSQAGLTFTAVQNGGAIPPQTFGVLNLGSGTLNWSVQTSTLPAGGSWLNATPGNGSSDAAAPQGAPLVTVSVNPSGLPPGMYYGLVQVVSAEAANTPQAVVAVLQVLPPKTDVAPIVQPSSLIFTAPAGVSSPSSQTVLVYDPTGTSKSFSSGIVTNGSGQLVTLPTDATIPPTGPTQVVVQPIVNGLSPGTYPGTLTLQFSDGRVNAVGITFVVTGTPSSRTASSAVASRALPLASGTSICTPTKLIPVLTTLSPSFETLVGYPTGLSAQVMDDCGNPQTSGHVTVTFTNGDPPLGLTSLNNGTWQATWYAGTQSAGQPVKLTVTAVNTQPPISGTTEVDGGIASSEAQPTILQGGVVGAASPVSFTALAPGGIISIYGNLLADSSASAPGIPLPTTLGNTNVIIGGQSAPLYFASPGQINAVVPFGLNTNTAYSVLIQRDLALSSPVAVNIADAQPGAFLSAGSAIVEDSRGTAPVFLVTPSTPAQAGDVLVIYCAGLGVTNQPVADGAASPSSPLAQTQAPVTVSIGGQNANVLFAGLTPTLVGLYQVNVVMPAGVPPGTAVPVMLTAAGQTSPAAMISTQ